MISDNAMLILILVIIVIVAPWDKILAGVFKRKDDSEK